jgi:hypothetical protein
MASIFFGDVIEKSGSTPQPMIQRNTGFPESIVLRSKPRELKTILKSNITIGIQTTEFNFEQLKDYEIENIQKILNMSEDERKTALEEISQSISNPETLNYLKSSMKNKNQVETEFKKKDYFNPPFDMSLISTENELKVAVSNSSKPLQDSLRWTSENVNISDKIKSDTLNQSFGNRSSSKLYSRLTTDRFDLNGSRVVEPGIMKDQILKVLKDSSPFSLLSSLELDSITDCIINMLYESHILIIPPVESETQPQHELYNHESDQEKPGYTFKEIDEVIIKCKVV